MRILIMGAGVVGRATAKLLEQCGHECCFHDPPQDIEHDSSAVDVALICVPTPMGPMGYNCRQAVYQCADTLSAWRYRGSVGIRSTVVPGTCAALQGQYPDMDWFSWPEFLRDGKADDDILRPARRVFGIPRDQSAAMTNLIEPLLTCDGKTLLTTTTGAEFVKYATNAFHAAAVGLANELAMLAQEYSLDWNALLPPLADEYIPRNIVVTEQGGFGGKCLPKDTAALLYHARTDKGVTLPMLEAMDAANRARRPEEYAGG